MSTTDQPVGLSVWEQELLTQLTNHVDTEATVLDDYVQLAESAGGHVKYLLDMIGEDEARHHRLFNEWAASIRAMAELRDAPDGVPALGNEADPAAVISAVQRLLELERADAHELKRLQKGLKDFEDTTLWPLLVEVMAIDTQKHIKILEFLERHAKKTAKRQS